MSDPQNAPVSPEVLLSIYRKVYLINRTDERFRSMLTKGQLAVAYYPVRGQEVLAAAAMQALRHDDYLVTTYRGLHDSLAKGIPSRLLWAEFAGRRTGTCKGKGGPMHITHPETGVMVTTGIVGSGMPIAAGLAMAAQIRGADKVALVSFGDGASNIGAFHESLNMAAVWKLPVIFLCQNNRYAEHTAYAVGTSAPKIADRAAGYGIPGMTCDGLDPEDTYRTVSQAVARARAGDGPSLVENLTYRWRGHSKSDRNRYRTKDEIEDWMARDPIARFRAELIAHGVLDAAGAEAVEAEAKQAVADGVEFAKASPAPGIADVTKFVHAEEAA